MNVYCIILVLPRWCFVFVCKCTFYILVFTSSCDELKFVVWLSLYLLCYYGGCQYMLKDQNRF